MKFSIFDDEYIAGALRRQLHTEHYPVLYPEGLQNESSVQNF